MAVLDDRTEVAASEAAPSSRPEGITLRRHSTVVPPRLSQTFARPSLAAPSSQRPSGFYRRGRAALSREVGSALERAVDHALMSQRTNGSWEALPDPRVLETGLGAYALSCAPGDPDREASAAARRRLTILPPQRHTGLARLVEETICAIALGRRDFALDLGDPDLSGPVARSRAQLLYVLAMDAGHPVRSAPEERVVREFVRKHHERMSTVPCKQWSKAELIAAHVLLQYRARNAAETASAVAELAALQDPDGSFFANPVTTALAHVALARAAPESPTRAKCREHLLRTQQADGTWRFCTSDVWDTVLTLRSFRGHPVFDESARPKAVEFLCRQQNEDGGWSFRSNVESDNDTTGAAILALRGTPGTEQACARALAYLGRVQMADGLWRTWSSTDDPAVQDVNAHVVAALDATWGQHSHSTQRAREWLSQRYQEAGQWMASWYYGLPYAVCEVAEALGTSDPNVAAALFDLERAQNRDGGWSPEPGTPSRPSTTGLTLAALMRDDLALSSRSLLMALEYLVSTQRPDGTWPGEPEMYGPRPLLSHYQTHTQAFAVCGMIAAWKEMGGGG